MATKKVNLDTLNVAELTALIADAKQMRESKMEGSRHAFLSEMTEKAASIGIDITDLLTRAVPRRAFRMV